MKLNLGIIKRQNFKKFYFIFALDFSGSSCNFLVSEPIICPDTQSYVDLAEMISKLDLSDLTDLELQAILLLYCYPD